jgi:hypothetical protein
MSTGEEVSHLGIAVRRTFLAGFCLAVCLALGACDSKETATRLDPDMARAVAEKRTLAREMASVETNPVPREVWEFFDLVERNNWRQETNVFEGLRRQTASYYTPPPPAGFWSWLQQLLGNRAAALRPSALNDAFWSPVHETLGIAECFHDWDGPLLHRFGRDIIASIPTNSIYFGGTDPGRFVITALSQSHVEGRPFFTLTQNALADARYLDYLRRIYGSRIYIPTAADSQAAFTNYLEDARQRMEAGQLDPGEDVKVIDNRVQVSGQAAVMKINARLAKYIFDRNPDREFYLEESFPLKWMYPYLSPHGLILKLNRETLPQLPEPVTREDHEYWRQYTGQLVGNWLTDETSVAEVCDFAERGFVRHDLKAFTGDPSFATNNAAQKAFSKLRSAIGGIYVWRYEHAGTADEKARMAAEADYSFRQALALCPYSPEAVFRYARFLIEEKRPSEALRVAQTCQHIDPSNAQASQLVEQLQRAP